MFSPTADFSELSSSGTGKLMVSSMKHKTYVDVNEKGTEAAAVTGKSSRRTSSEILRHSSYFFFDLLVRFCTGAAIENYNLEYVPKDVKKVKFHACHPFLFIIKKDRDIIFMGRLSNPTA